MQNHEILDISKYYKRLRFTGTTFLAIVSFFAILLEFKGKSGNIPVSVMKGILFDFWGLPRCKNLTRFSLFVGFCFAVRCCLKCFCFLCFTSSVSFTGSYTEVKPIFATSCPSSSYRCGRHTCKSCSCKE